MTCLSFLVKMLDDMLKLRVGVWCYWLIGGSMVKL